MNDFELDDSKRFSENCVDFLENVKGIEPEMAAIVEANWDSLLTVVRQGERDSKARTNFNEAIAAALDELTAQTDDEEGD